MRGLLRRLRAAFRKRPAAAGPPMTAVGGTAHRRTAKHRRSRRRVTLQAAGTARLEALIAARFEALDAAMAARAQAQLLTLAQLIGEAIVAECRGLRQPAVAKTAGEGRQADAAVDRSSEAPTRATS